MEKKVPKGENYECFPEAWPFIDKAFDEECCEKKIAIDKVFFIIHNSC